MINEEKTPPGSFSSSGTVLRLARRLRLRREREKTGLCLVEGPRAVEEALTVATLEAVLHTPDFARERPALLATVPAGVPVFQTSEKEFDALARTETPQGILAVVRIRSSSWEKMVAAGRSLVVLDGLQDPGNLGTIIRAATAFGAGVVCGAGSVDPYNPKVVRATAGYLFRSPPALLPRLGVEGVELLRGAGYRIFAAAPKGGVELPEADLTGPVAVWIGNEGMGLPAEVLAAADGTLRIPAPGPVESLNAGVAAAIILYEIARHRE